MIGTHETFGTSNYLTYIYEWQEDHPGNIQTIAISLKPQYTK